VGDLAVWFLDGTTAADHDRLNPARLAGGWRVAAAVDLDRDGQLDLVFAREDELLQVWFMKGTHARKRAYPEPAWPGTDWRLIGPR
jgi:hypothetical protein